MQTNSFGAASTQLGSLDSSASPGGTSIKIFRRFIRHTPDSYGTSALDASAIVGAECFAAWRQSRVGDIDMERNFQRCLTAHLTKSDGRKPFDAAEEKAVLRVVRQKRTWPAFQGTTHRIGQKGFRALGFHERLTDSDPAASSPSHMESGNSSQVTPSSSEDCMQPLPHFGLEARDTTGRQPGPQPEASVRVPRTVTLDVQAMKSGCCVDDAESAHMPMERLASPLPELMISLRAEEFEEYF
jgi:hypothetical protein